MARPNLSVTVKPHDAAAIPDAFIPGIAILKGGIAARRLLARGEEQLRGKHRLELGKLLCKRGTIEHSAGDLHTAHTALSEASDIAEALEVTPDSDLGRAVTALQAMLG